MIKKFLDNFGFFGSVMISLKITDYIYLSPSVGKSMIPSV